MKTTVAKFGAVEVTLTPQIDLAVVLGSKRAFTGIDHDASP